ncbi:hypothetical protein BGX27_011587 [Mortierella sp. AM989]|nr:hypothetical protein BGX27_011587 [Mortierella sp. AM989]
MASTCDIDPSLIAEIEAFRFAKRSEGNAAIICKIDKNKLLIEADEVLESSSIEDLAEMLPENSPRYIVLSIELKHSDGRLSFPLVFIYYSPPGVKPELNMLYASAKTYFQNKVGLGKVFDVQNAGTLTKEWMSSMLLK